MKNIGFSVEIEPSEIFEWLRFFYDPQEAFGDDAIKRAAFDNFCPEEIYDAASLGLWAEENGYVKAEAIK